MDKKNFLEATISSQTASLLKAKALVAKCAEEVNEIINEPDDEQAQKTGEIVCRNFKVIDEVLSERMIIGINKNICKTENII